VTATAGFDGINSSITAYLKKVAMVPNRRATVAGAYPRDSR
jgi:hypothetical protein